MLLDTPQHTEWPPLPWQRTIWPQMSVMPEEDPAQARHAPQALETQGCRGDKGCAGNLLEPLWEPGSLGAVVCPCGFSCHAVPGENSVPMPGFRMTLSHSLPAWHPDLRPARHVLGETQV